MKSTTCVPEVLNLRSTGLVPWAQLQQSLGALHMAKGANDVALIRGLLQQLVSGYEPAGEVVDWVYLAQEREAVGGVS